MGTVMEERVKAMLGPSLKPSSQRVVAAPGPDHRPGAEARDEDDDARAGRELQIPGVEAWISPGFPGQLAARHVLGSC